MPAAPAAASSGAASAAPGAGGGNPFQLATNLYAEKNNFGLVTGATVGASQQPQGAPVNAGQYLRGIHLVVRPVSAGVSVKGLTGVYDHPWNLLTQIDLVNVDGSEILYPMNGYSHYLAQKYGKPWLGDPASYPDAAAMFASGATAAAQYPQFTLFLQPEIRWTAGCLANTDTRSQYRFDYTIDTTTNINSTSGTTYGTGPVISVTPYVDSWAQPDGQDLQGTPNQPVPPGLNLQVKRRHQIFTMNAYNSDNIFQSALTGNALRNQILVTRAGGSVRAEGLTDPVQWQVDNRSMGKFSVNYPAESTTGGAGGDIVGDFAYQFYASYYGSAFQASAQASSGTTNTDSFAREPGVYVFPRFLQPGELWGQGWLYTANSTKEIFESISAGAMTSATCELITDEVYPVGPIDPSLTDI